jgi:hypothetical protein
VGSFRNTGKIVAADYAARKRVVPGVVTRWPPHGLHPPHRRRCASVRPDDGACSRRLRRTQRADAYSAVNGEQAPGLAARRLPHRASLPVRRVYVGVAVVNADGSGWSGWRESWLRDGSPEARPSAFNPRDGNRGAAEARRRRGQASLSLLARRAYGGASVTPQTIAIGRRARAHPFPRHVAHTLFYYLVAAEERNGDCITTRPQRGALQYLRLGRPHSARLVGIPRKTPAYVVWHFGRTSQTFSACSSICSNSSPLFVVP